MLGVRRLLLLLTVVIGLVGLSASVASAHYNEGHEEACSKRGPRENNKHCDPCHPENPEPCAQGQSLRGHSHNDEDQDDANDVPNTAAPAERGCQRAASEVDNGAERAHDRATASGRRSNDVPDVTPHARGKCWRVASEVDNQAEAAHGDGTEARGETERQARATKGEAEAQASAVRRQAISTANRVIDAIQDELSD